MVKCARLIPTPQSELIWENDTNPVKLLTVLRHTSAVFWWGGSKLGIINMQMLLVCLFFKLPII